MIPDPWPRAIRSCWDVGTVTYGGWCAVGNSFSAELVARAGFDWVCIDQQHGLVGPDVLPAMIQAISGAGTPPFVRVPWNEPAAIMRALDAGAQGIIVPLVNTRADAQRAVAAARYPPLGDRSWGPIRPLQEVRGYTPASGNHRTIVAVQIETTQSVANVVDILAVPGVDAAFVGPSDLALSAGWEPTLTPDRPDHHALIMRVLQASHDRGLPAGIYCGTGDQARYWREAGFEMLAVTSDAIILRTGAATALAQARSEQQNSTVSAPAY